MKNLMYILATVLTVALSVPALAQNKADFIFVNRGEVSTLDPNRMSWMQDIRIGQAIYEGLHTLDPATIKPVLGAAEKMDLSDDGLVYTFTIRANAKWSNGDPVTAKDFAFAWRRMLETPGDYSYLFYYIKGAEDFEKAFAQDPKSADYSTVGIEVVSDKVLKVTLRNPTPFFPDLTAFAPYWPMNERAMTPYRRVDARGVVTYDATFMRPPNLVSNGPFKVTSWEPKVGQMLVQNEHYWDRANVRSRTIQSLTIEDELLAFEKYDRGEIDWLADMTGNIASKMRDAGRKDVKIFPSFGTYFYTFNCSDVLPGNRRNPFRDMRVRQAFTMAIDKQPIVDNITKLDEQICSVYVPPTFEGYNHPEGLPFDPERARQLLADAGYPGGRSFPSVKLLFNPEFNQHKLIAEYIRREWQEKLGVTVELESVEIVQFRERLNKKDYDVARASWYGDYMDISTFTDKYRSTSLNNDSNWRNAEYDELLNKAEAEVDPQKRADLLAQAENILVTEVPILPLYHYVNTWAYRDHVTGIIENPKMMVMLKHVSAGRWSPGGRN
jgi:oligopeptide transport system substrate-binding protein